MRFSLLPKANIFYQLLDQLAENVLKASQLFNELLDSWGSDQLMILELSDLEHDCDQIVHDIMVRLNQTFVTPIDREDIHNLTKQLDDVIDLIHTLSERMTLYRITTIPDTLKEVAKILHEAVSVIVATISKIKKSKDSKKLLQECIHIHTLENQADRLFESALGALFINNQEALEVIKWKDIYEYLERAVNACEDIADTVWSIVVKYG